MAAYRLYIGNRNYSSWSLRAWLPMAHFGIDFEELRLSLFTETFRREIAKVSPAGRVPVLLVEGFPVWDTLAIAETLAERHPGHALWPREAKARARARSICAEMHAGFAALRSAMPVNLEASLPGRGWNLAVQADIDRILAMWGELRAANATRGEFLFGGFSLADAFYAPVATRFVTYAVGLPPAAQRYVEAIYALPAMQRWIEAARAEHEFLPEDEPYRRSR